MGGEIHGRAQPRDPGALLLDGASPVRARGGESRALDLVSQQLKVRGKGRKERIVPIGDHAQLALRNYEAKRDELARALGGKVDRTAFFLSRTGGRIGVRAVQLVVGKFLDQIDEDAGLSRALASTHVRDAPARRGRRSPRGAGAPRPRVDRDDPDLHAHERGAAEAGVRQVAPARVSTGIFGAHGHFPRDARLRNPPCIHGLHAR